MLIVDLSGVQIANRHVCMSCTDFKLFESCRPSTSRNHPQKANSFSVQRSAILKSNYGPRKHPTPFVISSSWLWRGTTIPPLFIASCRISSFKAEVTSYFTHITYHVLHIGWVVYNKRICTVKMRVDRTGTGRGGVCIYDRMEPEFHSRLRFSHRGLVAMADDNRSQFFITLSETQELNNKHTIFGKVRPI